MPRLRFIIRPLIWVTLVVLLVLAGILFPTMFAAVFGAAIGMLCSVVAFGRFRGFNVGAALGLFAVPVPGLLAGTLFGGLGDELLGTQIGVLVGIAFGCFAAAFVICNFTGAVTAIITRLFSRRRGLAAKNH